MALIRPSALVGALSGSIDSYTFAVSRYGPHVKHRPLRTDKQTAPQLRQRSHYRAASIAWNNLTEVQRQGWRAAAANTPHTNRLGLRSALSGWNLFLAQTITRPMFGLTLPTDPPIPLSHIPTTGYTLTFIPGGVDYLSVDHAAPEPTSSWQLQLSRPYASRPTARSNRWSYITDRDTFGFTVPIGALIDLVFSPRRSTELIHSRLRLRSDHSLPSPWVYAAHTVP